MVDIAQIGFAADTTELKDAEGTLKRLPPAVNNAERATAKLNKTIDDTAASAGKIAPAINAANDSMERQSRATDKLRQRYERLKVTQEQVAKFAGIKGANDNVGRAADIDAYGKSLDALRAKYNPLFAAGQQYKATLAEINRALKIGAINEREHRDAIMNTKVAFTEQVNSIRGTEEKFKTFNGATDRTKKSINGLSWEAKNLSFQLVDVGQGLLSGQPLFMIFAQQAGQIGQIIGTSQQGLGGLFKELGRSIAAVLTPVRLIALGFIAAGAAMIYAATSTLSTSRALDDLGRSIDVSVAKLHGLEQAASFKGISREEFASGIKGFADGVYQARRNMGELNGLMIANGMTAKDLEGYFYNVAELVSRTTDGMQKQKILEAAGLPTTERWVRLMSQGRDGIRAAIAETVKFNTEAERNLVDKARAFDDAWNKATTKLSNGFKSLVIDGLDWFDRLKQGALVAIAAIGVALTIALAPLSLIAATITGLIAAVAGAKALGDKLTGADGEKKPTRVIITGGTQDNKPPPKTREELLAANQQAQQRISILGELATVEQQVALKQLEINAAYLNGVGPTKAQSEAIINLTRATALNNQVQQQAAIGIFNVDTAAKAAAATLQSWIDKKLLDPTNAQQMAAAHQVLANNIRATAEAAQVAASALPQLKQLELDTNNVSKVIDTAAVGAVNNLSNALGDIFNGTVKVGQGFKNMGSIILQALQQAIIKLMIIGPLMKAFSGGFGSLFGFSNGGVAAGGEAAAFAGGIMPMAKGGVFANDNVQRFANGGAFTNKVVKRATYFANGGALGVMGEAGPEAIMPLKRGPNGSLGVQMYGGNNGGDGGGNIVYAPVNTWHVGGNVTQEDIARIEKAQADDRASFTKRVNNANNELSRRNVQGRR